MNPLGAFNIPVPFSLDTKLDSAIDNAIVTPAERIGQYSLLGAFAGLGLAAVVGFGFDIIPKGRKLGTFGLLMLPALGAAAGVMLGAKESQP